MNCKRCGNEIIGEIQRYCNDCKKELNGEPREKKGFTQTEVKQSEMKQEKVKQEETKEVEEKRKRSLLATIGYILFVIIIMTVVFLGSIMIGFSMGPFLSF